jgi:hypothetical protein
MTTPLEPEPELESNAASVFTLIHPVPGFVDALMIVYFPSNLMSDSTGSFYGLGNLNDIITS